MVTNAPADAAEVVEALIAHPAVRRINFTGSTKVGRIIARSPRKHLKPVLLELGGKAPLVVLDDADLDEAVDAAVFGAFMNQGQICMSTERIIVDEKVADDFVESSREGQRRCRPAIRARARRAGLDGQRRRAERMSALVEDAIAKGAKVLPAARATARMHATVLDRSRPRCGSMARSRSAGQDASFA